MTPETQLDTHLLDMLKQGGLIMYPLLACSLFTWIIVIQKMLSFKFFQHEVKSLYKEAESLLSSGRFQDLAWLFKKSSPVIAQVHESIFDESIIEKSDKAERLERRLEGANDHLKKGNWILGTIASTTPFIGLFGTVMGIMESFKSIGVSGKSGFGTVSAGISESLITTATGIIIAVFAVAFYNVVQVKAQKVFKDLKNKAEDLAQVVGQMKNQQKNHHPQQVPQQEEYRQAANFSQPAYRGQSRDSLPPVPSRLPQSPVVGRGQQGGHYVR